MLLFKVGGKTKTLTLKSLMRTSIDTVWDPTKILEYLPKKAKIQILIENSDPTFTSETQIKGISNRPWPNDYNGIMNQRYKVWTPQGRIPDNNGGVRILV